MTKIYKIKESEALKHICSLYVFSFYHQVTFCGPVILDIIMFHGLHLFSRAMPIAKIPITFHRTNQYNLTTNTKYKQLLC